MFSLEFDAPLTEWSYERLLRWRVERSADSPFVSFEGSAYETYGQFNDRVRGLARGLANKGVKEGHCVAVIARNSLTAVHVWFAINLLGATDVAINPAFRGAPLAHALNLAGCSLIIAESDLVPNIEEVGDQLASATEVLWFGVVAPESNGESGSVLRKADLADHWLDGKGWQPPAVAFSLTSSILMTSGTSGPSKGVMVPQAQAILIGKHSAEGMRVTEDDTFYCAHPLFHMSPRYCIFTAAMLTGAKVWLDSGFKAEHWIDRIRLAQATVTIGHGPLLEMIFAQPERPDDIDNPLTRLATSPFPKHIAHAFERRFGLKGIETWGMTEVGIPCWHPFDAPLKAGSCGRVLRDWFDVKIVDPETDIEQPFGVVGELIVRAKFPFTMMHGYFGRQDATVEAWRNLWFHSGDGAYIDDAGWIYFVDRLKDRIRRRAENISSFDIEQAARSFVGVHDAAAIGVPSEFSGDDDIKLCVTASDAVTLVPDELMRHLARTLPHHMVPRYIEVLSELPRTPTQKVQKAILRKVGVTATTWDRKQAGVSLREIAGG